METLVEQPTREQQSFNPLASVNLLRYDLQHFGQVLPETRQRVYDEELSYLAEGVDRAARTTFTLSRQDGDLAYFSNGQWRPYQSLLLTGMQVAEREATTDPRRQFLTQRATEDYQIGLRLQQLQPGESLIWHSPYPEEETARYGDDFMRQCGFRPDRQMGFLYQARCGEDGSVTLQTQTVDRSSDEAFAATLAHAEAEPDVSLDTLTQTYDDVLAQKYGGDFYAGRRDAEREENAWEFITQQRDLVQYFLDGIESIAAREATPDDLEIAAKRHVYGVWAAFKRRLDGEVRVERDSHTEMTPVAMMIHQTQLKREVATALDQFVKSGIQLVGCGGTIRLQSEKELFAADADSVFGAIFGKEQDDDQYGSLKFKCQKGHANTRPRGKLIPRCKTCGISVAC